MDGFDVRRLVESGAVGGASLAHGIRSLDDRTPEELAEAGITVTVDDEGKRHIRMAADPMVLVPGGPRSVECGFGCGADTTFTESGPTGGWIPPHPGRDSWTCPACRGDLKPLKVTRRVV